MDAIVAERPSREISAQAEKPSFLFSSPHFAIEAYGVFERIRTPAGRRRGRRQRSAGGGRRCAGESASRGTGSSDRRRRDPLRHSRQPSFLFAPKTHRISAPRMATSAPEAKASVPALWYRSVPGQSGFRGGRRPGRRQFSRRPCAQGGAVAHSRDRIRRARRRRRDSRNSAAAKSRRLSFPRAAARRRRSARREPRAADPQDRRLHPLQSAGGLGEARRGAGRGRAHRAPSPAIEQGQFRAQARDRRNPPSARALMRRAAHSGRAGADEHADHVASLHRYLRRARRRTSLRSAARQPAASDAGHMRRRRPRRRAC